MSNETSEGLPEGWRAAPHGPILFGDAESTMVEATDVGVVIGDKDGNETIIPTAVILWLADRLRPATEPAPALTDAVPRFERPDLSGWSLASTHTFGGKSYSRDDASNPNDILLMARGRGDKWRAFIFTPDLGEVGDYEEGAVDGGLVHSTPLGAMREAEQAWEYWWHDYAAGIDPDKMVGGGR